MGHYNYVAEPQVVGDDSEYPVLAVGYPVEQNPVLLWKRWDEDGDGDKYEPITQLDDDTVDSLIQSLESYREQSPQYRDNK